MTVLFEKPEDLAEYLFRITDNGGSSVDRYTVVFSDGDALGLSRYPWHPQGISQWSERIDLGFQHEQVEEGLEVDLALGDLPEGLAGHILARCNQAFADVLELIEARNRKVVAPSRDAAEINEGIWSSTAKGIYASGDAFMVRLDGDPNGDRGPFDTAREALVATLPDRYSLSGPEYHSTLEPSRPEPDSAVIEAVAALEAKLEEEGPRP